MTKQQVQIQPLGQLLTTPGAANAIAEAGDTAWTFIHRHQSGDWGDVCEEDKRANDEAATRKGRILSAYHTSKGIKLWVITEWDRSATTILLPDEY